MAADFVEKFSIGFDVFTDPSRQAYKLAGLKKTLGLGLKTISAGTRAFRQGFRQSKTQGDPFQQGGVLIVNPRGELLFRHVDSGAGAHMEPSDVLAQYKQLQSAA